MEKCILLPLCPFWTLSFGCPFNVKCCYGSYKGLGKKKKTFYHGFGQTLVLVNRTLLSGQLFKVMRRKLNWHIIKLKRKEELKKIRCAMIKSSIYTFSSWNFVSVWLL